MFSNLSFKAAILTDANISASNYVHLNFYLHMLESWVFFLYSWTCGCAYAYVPLAWARSSCTAYLLSQYIQVWRRHWNHNNASGNQRRFGCGAGRQPEYLLHLYFIRSGGLLMAPPTWNEIRHLMHTAEKEAKKNKNESNRERDKLRKLRVVKTLTLKSAFDIYIAPERLSGCILSILSFGCLTRY